MSDCEVGSSVDDIEDNNANYYCGEGDEEENLPVVENSESEEEEIFPKALKRKTTEISAEFVFSDEEQEKNHYAEAEKSKRMIKKNKSSQPTQKKKKEDSSREDIRKESERLLRESVFSLKVHRPEKTLSMNDFLPKNLNSQSLKQSKTNDVVKKQSEIIRKHSIVASSACEPSILERIPSLTVDVSHSSEDVLFIVGKKQSKGRNSLKNQLKKVITHRNAKERANSCKDSTKAELQLENISSSEEEAEEAQEIDFAEQEEEDACSVKSNQNSSDSEESENCLQEDEDEGEKKVMESKKNPESATTEKGDSGREENISETGTEATNPYESSPTLIHHRYSCIKTYQKKGSMNDSYGVSSSFEVVPTQIISSQIDSQSTGCGSPSESQCFIDETVCTFEETLTVGPEEEQQSEEDEEVDEEEDPREKRDEGNGRNFLVDDEAEVSGEEEYEDEEDIEKEEMGDLMEEMEDDQDLESCLNPQDHLSLFQKQNQEADETILRKIFKKITPSDSSSGLQEKKPVKSGSSRTKISHIRGILDDMSQEKGYLSLSEEEPDENDINKLQEKIHRNRFMFQNQSKNLGKHDFMKMTLPFSKSSNFEINKNSQQNVTVVQKKISTMDTSLIRKMNHKGKKQKGSFLGRESFKISTSSCGDSQDVKTKPRAFVFDTNSSHSQQISESALKKEANSAKGKPSVEGIKKRNGEENAAKTSLFELLTKNRFSFSNT